MTLFTLHYKRRARSGVYTATVRAFSNGDAREAVMEFEKSRGYQVTRFTDEPEALARECDARA